MLRHRRLFAIGAAFAVAGSMFAGWSQAARSASQAGFAVASVGPGAGARVDASVTRTVDGKPVTLPAAMVPALADGDVVSVTFPDYVRPPARANYHVDAAFITEAAPQRWLYPKSGPRDRLFSNDHRRRTPFVPAPLRFVYGRGNARGIPLIFIVPEDGKTRGMDGVRDYVDAHPTDFKNMSESANQAVAQYSWFRDFVQSLASGSLDPLTGQQRAADIAISLGAPPTTVQGCYTDGATESEVASCIQTALLSVQYQTNIEAPTTAEFFGNVAGSVAPSQLALYLLPMYAIWQIFARVGHQEYEYLPAALEMTPPPKDRPDGWGEQLLIGAKVPTLRPPGAQSSVLFFTIGDTAAQQNPPHVVDDAPAAGVCATAAHLALPLHLDQTSPYVNDTTLVVTPDGGAPYTIPLDPRSLLAPTLERAQLSRAGASASVRLNGRYGFAPLAQEQLATARIAVPHAAQWTVASLPDRAPIAGRSLDVIASSDAAPCLTAASLQLGNAPPVPLAVTHLDAHQVELRASLEHVTAGEAQITFTQAATPALPIENAVGLAIEGPPPSVDASAVQTAGRGDRFVRLTGSGFERVSALQLDGATFAKDADSTSQSACFSGPPIGASATPGQALSAQLLDSGGRRGEIFDLRLGAARPQVALLPSTPAANGTHLSTDPFAITLAAAGGLPVHAQVRVRRARAEATPCDAVDDSGVVAVVPDDATHLVDGSQLAVTLRTAQLLGDRAFGTLQVQLVDADSKAASDWVDLPGTFVRAPSIARIECPPDAALPCRMLGSELSAIAGVQEPAGGWAAPQPTCAGSDGLACVTVPHLAHYTLQLQDGATTLALPDALINPPKPKATPSPSS